MQDGPAAAAPLLQTSTIKVPTNHQVSVVGHDGDELRLPPAHPEGGFSGHVVGEGLVALLEATAGKALKRGPLPAQVQPPRLVQPKAHRRQQACEVGSGE